MHARRRDRIAKLLPYVRTELRQLILHTSSATMIPKFRDAEKRFLPIAISIINYERSLPINILVLRIIHVCLCFRVLPPTVNKESRDIHIARAMKILVQKYLSRVEAARSFESIISQRPIEMECFVVQLSIDYLESGRPKI